MAKVGSFIKSGVLTPGVAIGLTTSFNAASAALSLNRSAPAFAGHLGAIYVYVNTIAGGATKLTVRLTSDAGGDECVVPDTEATLAAGVTTATDGTVVIKVDIPYTNAGHDAVYPFFKTDAGTCNMVTTIVTWRE